MSAIKFEQQVYKLYQVSKKKNRVSCGIAKAWAYFMSTGELRLHRSV
jgi:hypothetical protein